MVPAPLWIAGKVALYWAMEERNLTNVEFASMLGVRETVVRRMLDPDHETKAEKLAAALRTLGKRLVVEVRRRCRIGRPDSGTPRVVGRSTRFATPTRIGSREMINLE
jgi:hypothetical protein